MTEDLLDVTQEVDTPASPLLDIPEKFRDPATGALRIEALLKSYLELERAMSRRVAAPGADAPEEDRAPHARHEEQQIRTRRERAGR